MNLLHAAVPSDLAFRQALKSPHRKFPDREDARFQNDLVFSAISPGFQIAAGSEVFTIGSCFARNVEEELAARGIVVPTMEFKAPASEAKGRPNRMLNQYNPGTMCQVVEATMDGSFPQGGLYEADDGQAVDSLLSTGSTPVARARAEQRRQEILSLYQGGLARCDTVVITLGLVEAWYDQEAELYLNDAPARRWTLKDPGRFRFRRLGVAECTDLVSRMITRLTSDRTRNIVLTVSPVPLQTTFSGEDAQRANTYSKSVLRIVAEEMAASFETVDYFPSYEIVMSGGLHSFGGDNVHVRPRVVARVVDYMLQAYLGEAAQPELHVAPGAQS